MTNLPLFTQEPNLPFADSDEESAPPIDWNTFELSDEPPVDWDFPTEFLDMSPTDPRAELEAALADLDRQLERADENENTLERYARRDTLLEDREAFEAQLAALEPAQEWAFQPPDPSDPTEGDGYIWSMSDLPPDTLDINESAWAACEVVGVVPGQERDFESFLRQTQAVEALRAAGLGPSEDFDLGANALLDPDTGSYYVVGIYQADMEDPTSVCQAVFVPIEPGPEGMAVKDVVPIGLPGSFDEVTHHWDAVKTALDQEGIDGALRVMQEIEEQTPQILAGPSEPPQEGPGEPEVSPSFDIGM